MKKASFSTSGSTSHSNSKKSELILAWRVVDANLNRLRDALRVIEDTLRFVKSDPLWGKFRDLRNKVGRLFSDENYPLLLTARDSSKDSGRNSKQKRHKNIFSILKANFARASESLRVLEEYSRLLCDHKKVLAFKKIRFILYDAEKKFWSKHNGKQ